MTFDLLVFLNISLICFECIMTAYFSNCIFERKYSRFIYIFSVCLLAGFNIIFLSLQNLEDAPVAKLLLDTFLHSGWILLVYQANIIKTIFTSAFLMSYWMIMDFIFLICVSLFYGNDIGTILDTPYTYYLMCFTAKIFEFLIILLIGTIAKKHFQVHSLPWTGWLRTLFFPLTSLLISIELVSVFFKAPSLARELSVCACMLLFVDVMSMVLLDHIEKQQIAIRDNAILQQNLKTERESILSWVTAYQEERKRSHDFQNQLSVLRGLVEDDAPRQQFLQYLDSLLNVKLPVTRYIDTNRPVADVLLSQKAAISKSKGIPLQMQLDNLSGLPLSDDELVVVLANLLDNAIEACEKMQEKTQCYILLKIRCEPEVTYIHIENSTSESVVIKNNHIIQSRKRSNAHGFGLQNVTTILDNHQALYTLRYQEPDSVFCFSAQLLTNP